MSHAPDEYIVHLMNIENIFHQLFDNLLENERFQEAIQNSLNTYNDELFQKTDEFQIDLTSQQLIPYGEDMETTSICQICLETMLHGEWIYRLPCQHSYHKDCLQKSIEHQHYECPLCKHAIPIRKKVLWTEEEYEQDGHRIQLLSNSI